ncbi:MAG TPA: SAM-dependent methyltransferase [Acidimicrobiia bacterium]|nr:SAM-dependent methyltransferase [Acidimicrobiia bacterium]
MPNDPDELITAAERAPIEGWDFSWLDGRATEERPPWGYTRMVVPRLERARAVLDVQTGGAEVFAEVLDRATQRPGTIAATESWAPNRALATERLKRFRGTVAAATDDGPLPFGSGALDLVISRHPVMTRWDEVARVLDRDGHYFAQHVGPETNRELTEFVMGPQQPGDARAPERAVAEAAANGLELVDLRQVSLRVDFSDVGAVVYFLRKVIWTVPDFTVERYRDRLVDLHARIRDDGVFTSHAQRFLIELRKR